MERKGASCLTFPRMGYIPRELMSKYFVGDR
jgi:hypothetical protein